LDAYDRQKNPELIIDFNDYAVKFHEVSLLDVRNIEAVSAKTLK